jgi:hypothetical protein
MNCRRECCKAAPPRVEYRQTPNVDPVEAQRRLRAVYRLILDAGRRSDFVGLQPHNAQFPV